MNSGVIGKILYFWIFILGALIFAKLFRFFDTDKQLIIFLIAVAVVYIVWNVMRELGKSKRLKEERQAAAPVRKGQSGKRKKRR